MNVNYFLKYSWASGGHPFSYHYLKKYTEKLFPCLEILLVAGVYAKSPNNRWRNRNHFLKLILIPIMLVPTYGSTLELSNFNSTLK